MLSPVKKPTKQDRAKATDQIKNTGTNSSEDEKKLGEKMSDEWQAGWDTLSSVRQTFKEKEAMLVSRGMDSISGTTKSQVNDPRLATIVLERAARVMAQLPTGKVQALTQDDTGKNMLMNLTLNKYIYPNANTQFDLLTKFRLWDVYADVYGSMPMLGEYRIDDGYIGPDCSLIPIRNWVPQPGRFQARDLDYSFVDVYRSVGWLGKRNKAFWKNLDDVIVKAKDKGEALSSRDSERKSYTEENNYPNIGVGKGDSSLVLLRTKYIRDRWITFCPNQDNIIVRDIANPLKNNRVNIVVKHCFPLLDSIIGLGEFERGKTLQFAINSLINLYLDGVKMSIFPPILIDPSGVVPSSIKFNPAAKWLQTKPNSINPFTINPRGIETFQSTYQFLIGAILNQAGTTDTTISAGQDYSQGKTPEALKNLAQRESSRDNWDRYMMEKSIEELLDMMIDMVSQKQEKDIDFNIFGSEIKQIKKQYPYIKNFMETSKSGNMGKISVSKKELGNTKYKFFIDSGTSMKNDDDKTHQIVENTLVMFMKAPQLLDLMAKSDQPRTIDFGELMESYINTSGLPNPDKIVKDITPEKQPQQTPDGQPAQPGMPDQQPQPGQAPQPPQGGQPNPQELMQMLAGKQSQQPETKESISIAYKDAPEDIKRQMEQKAGFTPSNVSPVGSHPMQSEHMIAQMSNGAIQPGDPTAPQGMPQQDFQGQLPQQPQQSPSMQGGFQFKNPEIQALASQIMGGQHGQ